MKNHSLLTSRGALAASLLLSLAITGCSFGQGGSDVSEDIQSSFNADTSAKVTLWYPSGAEYNTALTDAIARFQQTYPNVTFKIVKKAGLDIYQSYLIALNDDNSRPDLAIVDHVYIPNLAFEDQVANITELSNGDGVASNFPSTLYSANSYNGSAYGLPLSANTVVLMGNMDDTRWYGSSRRGSFPMTWTVSPALADLGPSVLENIYSRGSANDDFIAGPSGIGYINPSEYNEASLPDYSAKTAGYMA